MHRGFLAPLQVCECLAQVVVHSKIIGSTHKGTFEVRHSVSRPVHAEKSETEVVVVVCYFRLHFDRTLQMVDCFLISAEVEQRQTELAVDHPRPPWHCS